MAGGSGRRLPASPTGKGTGHADCGVGGVSDSNPATDAEGGLGNAGVCVIFLDWAGDVRHSNPGGVDGAPPGDGNNARLRFYLDCPIRGTNIIVSDLGRDAAVDGMDPRGNCAGRGTPSDNFPARAGSAPSMVLIPVTTPSSAAEASRFVAVKQEATATARVRDLILAGLGFATSAFFASHLRSSLAVHTYVVDKVSSSRMSFKNNRRASGKAVIMRASPPPRCMRACLGLYLQHLLPLHTTYLFFFVFWFGRDQPIF